MASDPSRSYGNHYYCVRGVKESWYVMVESWELTPSGALIGHGKYRHYDGATVDHEDPPFPAIFFAPGEWKQVWAASCLNGEWLSLEHLVANIPALKGVSRLNKMGLLKSLTPASPRPQGG